MSTKLVIIDDEERIVQLIKVLIHWEELPLKFMGSANDGRAGLKLIDKVKPDIVLIDMKMPGYNGIELIGMIRDTHPHIHFIIISGYRSFDYAHQAIKYGVDEYLLKPVKEEELNRSLKKLINSGEDKKSVKESLYRDDYKEISHPSILFHVNNDLNALLFNNKEIQLLNHKSESIITSFLQSREVEFYHIKESGLIYTVLVDEIFSDRDLFIPLLEELKNLNEIFHNLETTIAWTKCKTLEKDINAINMSIKERYISGTGKVYKRTILNDAGAYLKYYTPPEKSEILKSCELFDIERLKIHLSGIEHNLLNSYCSGEEVIKVVHEIISTVKFSLSSHVEDFRFYKEEVDLLKTLINQQSSIDRVFMVLTNVLDGIFSNELELRKRRVSTPIREVKKYINDRFFMNVTLTEVSEFVGMNPSYFSTLFKKETGMGFLEYLTNVRIEEAKELLGDPNRPICDTASEVGYKDIKHFAKQFKKRVGLSPIEYRKVYY